MKILIIDDSPVTRKIIQKEFAGGDFSLREAVSGEEGLEVLKHFQPNLITMGVAMKGMNGYQLCREIRSTENAHGLKPHERTPIIFITSSNKPEEREKGFSAGATDFFLKPFAPGSLQRRALEIGRGSELLRDLTALVVDDSKVTRHMIKHTLTRRGVKVLEAENGVDGLTKIEETPDLDIIISDYQMPEMDGDEFCKALRKIPGLSNIPVIMLSGQEDKETALKMFKAGATDYISKPLSMDELLARIFVHLEIRKLTRKLQFKNAQMEKDLELAKEVQQAVFKDTFHVPFLEKNVLYLPHSLVSGDIYAFRPSANGNFDGFVGDATGHGIAAAFMTMMAQTALNSTDSKKPVGEILSDLHALIKGKSGDHYLTGFYFRLSPEGEMTYSSAGHPPMIVIPKNGPPQMFSEKGGFPLGMFDMPADYEEGTLTLKKGDQFFVYTDGFLEWENTTDEQFGPERFLESLMTHHQKPLNLMIQNVLEDLETFADGRPTDDDLTLVGFRFK